MIFYLIMIAFLSLPLLSAADEVSSLNSKEWRQTAIDRPRRIIVNNDGNEPVMILKRPSAEELLALRCAPLVGTQVDSIFYCTWSSGFGLFTHFTKQGQIFTSREDRHLNNQMSALVEANIDPLRAMLDFAHSHGLEFFWSMRMNDNHDGYTDKYGPALFEANQLKVAHPEYLLGTRGQTLPYGSWSAVNYALPEICELAFRYIEEVCCGYDVDGVELDFFRHPVFFPSTTRGEPATDEEIEMMTQLLRRIRTMSEAECHRRGRPLLIAVRVPDSAAYARTIGLDLEGWLAEDLVDLLIVGGYFQLNDWEQSVTLARKYGVKIYASLDDARTPDPDGNKPSKRMTDPAYRGRAAVAWAAGVDGLYFFNQFNPRRSIWKEVGDPEGIARLDKDYFASVLGQGNTPMRSNLPLEKFRDMEMLAPDSPRSLLPGNRECAIICLAESRAAEEGQISSLRLRMENLEVVPEDLEVNWNGVPLRNGVREDAWLVYKLESGIIRKKDNEVCVLLKSEKFPRVQWLDLMVRVRYPRAFSEKTTKN